MILGIDEVGRGAWAGPMVVGAVVLGDAQIPGLNDSKKLTAKKRRDLAIEIKRQARGIGVGWVSSSVIDSIGLSAALKLAARRAVGQIDCDYGQIIIDGTVRLIDDPRVSVLPRADGLVSAVSAASIIAKVARDNYMTQCEQVFEGYNFASHVGYGTALHQAAITDYGVLPIHRNSFAPIAKILGNNTSKTDKISSTAGRQAENIAAQYLINLGHEIIEQNWKTKYCEVDIISKFEGIVYFTEVKYREIDRWGNGLDAITNKKENQMRFAAKFWFETHGAKGKIDARLSVVAVSGNDPVVEHYIPDIN